MSSVHRFVRTVILLVAFVVMVAACTDRPATPTATVSRGSDQAALTSTPRPTRTPTPTAPAPSPTATPVVYIVQAGDTLQTIADRFGVTVEMLVAANDIEDPNLIQVGQELRIPSVSAETEPAPQPTEQSLPTATPAETQTSGTATVTNVVDGDTIDVEIDGRAYRVRYIGIDTPEAGDPFYREAAQANANLVAGREVVLEKDVSETDRFDRLLRYVYLADGTFVNARLVQNGYAQAATFPPDVAHADAFAALQEEARANCRGLWAEMGACEVTPTPPPPPTEPPPPTQPPSQNCDPSYPDLCIPPPPPDLDCGEITYRRFRVLPPDPHRFDGDNDGIGCESG